jgi:YD repeat-containing protein
VGIWFGSTITYNASTPGWDLKRKDGTVYSFGKGAPLQKITDRWGNSITITHSSGQTGKITQVASSNGRYVNFSYTDSSNPNQITAAADSARRTVNYTYNANSALKTVTYASFNSSATTTYSYAQTTNAGYGDVTTITFNVKLQSGGGIATNANFITYDASHRLASISSQLPSSGYQYGYSLGGGGYISQCTVTLPDNSVRVLQFNLQGYLTADVRASGTSIAESTEYARDLNTDLITEVIDPLNRTTTYTYDSLGNVLTVTHTPGPGTSSSATTTYTYEPAFNRLASVQEPLTPATTITYQDPPSTPTATIVQPMSRTTVITYNSEGQVMSEQDPAGNLSSFAYNSTSGDLTSATDPIGNTTTYSTDAVGRLTSVTSPLSNTTTYHYDAIGGVLSITDANNHRTTYQYDLLGDPTQITDANNNVTTITTTATLDVTTICDAANNCSTQNRDAAGRRTTFIDKRGIKTAWTYDKLGRVTQVVYNSNGVSGFDTRTITYSYDAGDRVTSVTDSEGIGSPPQLQYTYDPVDNITSEQSAEGTISYQYDANGRRTTMSASQLPEVSYTYYNDDQLQSVTNATAAASLALDNDGRLSALTVNNVTTTYGYDNDSRVSALTYVASGNLLGTLTYGYDADGRMVDMGGSLAATNFPAALTASYTNTNQVNVWNGSGAADDAASNLTRNPARNQNYAWDSRNMLTQVNGGTVAFNYDALGRRERMNADGLTSYLHDGDAAVVASTPSALDNFLTDDGGDVLAFSQTAQQVTNTYVPLIDAMGSTLALVDGNGNLVNSYVYDPAGAPLQNGPLAYPYQYAGSEFDPRTGLYHVGSYYDPVLERLVSGASPTGAGGPNLTGGSGPVRTSGGSSDTAIRAAIAGGDFAATATEGILSLLANGEGLTTGGVLSVLGLAGVSGGGSFEFGLLGFFGVFGGGSSPFIPNKAYDPRHSMQGGYLGSPYVILTQWTGSSSEAKSSPEMSAPQHFELPRAAPSKQFQHKPKFDQGRFNSCIEEHLLSGEGSTVTATCLSGSGVCLATGAAPACIAGYVACLSGIGIEAACHKYANGGPEPHLPLVKPAPPLEGERQPVLP